MAGESAREVARRAREKADRLNRRAELFERGADGEAATAGVLAGLPAGWTSFHDVRWPGRRLANVDHVLIGPGGIFVIDSKNWSGRITANGGHLRQNGYSRERAVAGAADAALAVAELASPYGAWVRPVICFVGHDGPAGWSREVMLCTTSNVVEMVTACPPVFSPEHAQDAAMRLDLALKSAMAAPQMLPGRQRPAPRPERRAVRSQPKGRSHSRRRKKGPSVPRFLVGIVMMIGLITVGPQLAPAIGGLVADQLTKGLTPSECADTTGTECESK